MSTRATYLFKPTDRTPETCFYIHHDGYELGAAAYMFNTINQGGFSAEGFLRANNKAEFTSCHDAHGDTEFRYTFEGNRNVTCEKRVYHNEIASWRCEYQGTIENFVNSYLKPGEWFNPSFDCSVTTYKKQLRSIADLLKEYELKKDSTRTFEVKEAEEIDKFLNAPVERKGLVVSVFMDSNPDCTNNGISSRYTELLLVGDDIPEIFDGEGLPRVELNKGYTEGTVFAAPTGATRGEYMAGGNFLYTSDSRFSDAVRKITGSAFVGAVPIHDRKE